MGNGVNNTSEIFRGGDLVAVLSPLPVDRAYDYLVPEGMQLSPGDLVEVEVGPIPLLPWSGGRVRGMRNRGS